MLRIPRESGKESEKDDPQSSANSTKAKRRRECGSPHTRQSRTCKITIDIYCTKLTHHWNSHVRVRK